MRIAFLNRAPANPPGGDRIAIGYTIEALRKLGIEAELLYGEGLTERLKAFDMAHLFHCEFEFCPPNFKALAESGVRYVVTPIFYPEFWGTWIPANTAREVLLQAESVLPFSWREAKELREVLGVCDTIPVPNGTDSKFHAAPSNGNRVGVCAADAWGFKGADITEKACAISGVPYTYLHTVAHNEMPAAYRSHRVFVTVTKSDRMSLTVGEALCSGCRVLASTANRGNEWYPALKTISPDITVEDLAREIKQAYHVRDWNYMPNAAARELTWDRTAEQLVGVYRQVLA